MELNASGPQHQEASSADASRVQEPCLLVVAHDLAGSGLEPFVKELLTAVDACLPGDGSLHVECIEWSGLSRRPHRENDRLLALVVSPTRVMATAADQGLDVLGALNGWTVGAQSLLERYRRAPQRHVLMDLDALGDSCSEVNLLIRDWAGLPLRELDQTVMPRVDRLPADLHALCQSLLRSAPIANMLAQELAVACLPTGDVSAQFKTPGLSEAIQANLARSAEAKVAIRRALDAEAAREHAMLDTRRVSGHLHYLEQRLEASSTREGQVVSELDAMHLKLRTADSRAVRAESRLSELQAELGRIRTLLHASQAQTEAEQRRAESERQAGLEEGQRLAAKAAELAVIKERMAQLEDEVSAVSVGRSWPWASVRKLAVGPAQEVGQHQHLELELHDVKILDRVLHRCRLRLVRHQGLPGLVLFAGDATERPLRAWSPQGSEDGKEFMLFVPRDETARASLDSLGQSDWLVLDALARSLRWHLTRHSPPGIRPTWISVSAAFERQLAVWPARLRYDAIHVQPSSTHRSTVDVSLENAAFGSLALGRVALRWTASPARVEWRASTDQPCQAMGCWPLSAEGHCAETFVLPVGGGSDARTKRLAWSRLAGVERDLLLGILDALASVGAAADDALYGVVERKSVYADAGESLRAEARAGLRMLRWRQALRRRLHWFDSRTP